MEVAFFKVFSCQHRRRRKLFLMQHEGFIREFIWKLHFFAIFLQFFALHFFLGQVAFSPPWHMSSNGTTTMGSDRSFFLYVGKWLVVWRRRASPVLNRTLPVFKDTRSPESGGETEESGCEKPKTDIQGGEWAYGGMGKKGWKHTGLKEWFQRFHPMKISLGALNSDVYSGFHVFNPSKFSKSTNFWGLPKQLSKRLRARAGANLLQTYFFIWIVLSQCVIKIWLQKCIFVFFHTKKDWLWWPFIVLGLYQIPIIAEVVSLYGYYLRLTG